MWSCVQIRKCLNAYMDGELPERIRHRVEHHLAECPTCRHEYEALRRLAPWLRNETVPPVPAGLAARIVTQAAYRQTQNGLSDSTGLKWKGLLIPPRPVRGMTAAALFIGLALGAWMGWTSHAGSGSEAWSSPTNRENEIRSIYALDVLGAEPQGSIEAAIMTFLDEHP
ncbi:MAG: zf-HC2 domain-containing protein [Candidatus Delongbacteria bacterium]|nr:zf-HC2 domain-containing protein [Candidatus Delongbacteria bacterium]